MMFNSFMDTNEMEKYFEILKKNGCLAHYKDIRIQKDVIKDIYSIDPDTNEIKIEKKVCTVINLNRPCCYKGDLIL